MHEVTYKEAIREALREEMKRDESVFLIGEDIGKFGGPYQLTAGFLDEFGPERVKDTCISETAIVGTALGAAMLGMRPVAEIMFIDFMMIAMDQIINQVAKIHYTTSGQMKAPLVLRTLQTSLKSGGPQHSQSLEALFAHIPGLRVVFPSTPYDAKGLCKSAIRSDDPVVYIDCRALYEMKGPIPDDEYLVPIGKADIKRKGKDVTVVAVARNVVQALEASKSLEKEGIDVEVVDLRTISPLDKDTIIGSVKKTSKLVIVHDACKTGGIGAEIAALAAEEALDYLDAPIKRVACPDTPIPLSPKLERHLLPDVDDIVKAVKDVVK
jgi:acetoin:2,6-dichlorophenolindophenol oxidoreductase subunit beta